MFVAIIMHISRAHDNWDNSLTDATSMNEINKVFFASFLFTKKKTSLHLRARLLIDY
jgi:hypothetical protein